MTRKILKRWSTILLSLIILLFPKQVEAKTYDIFETCNKVEAAQAKVKRLKTELAVEIEYFDEGQKVSEEKVEEVTYVDRDKKNIYYRLEREFNKGLLKVSQDKVEKHYIKDNCFQKEIGNTGYSVYTNISDDFYDSMVYNYDWIFYLSKIVEICPETLELGVEGQNIELTLKDSELAQLILDKIMDELTFTYDTDALSEIKFVFSKSSYRVKEIIGYVEPVLKNNIRNEYGAIKKLKVNLKYNYSKSMKAPVEVQKLSSQIDKYIDTYSNDSLSYETQIKNYKDLIRINKNYEAYYLMANNYNEMGDMTNALKAINNYLEYFPANDDAIIYKANILYKMGMSKEIISVLKKYTEAYGYSERVMDCLTNIYIITKKQNDLDQVLADWHAIAPFNNAYLSQQLRRYDEIGNYIAAKRLVKTAFLVKDDNSDELLTEWLRLVGQYSLHEGLEYYARFEDALSNNQYFLRDYLEYLWEANDINKIKEVTDSMLKEDPRNQVAIIYNQLIEKNEGEILLNMFTQDYLFINNDIKKSLELEASNLGSQKVDETFMKKCKAVIQTPKNTLLRVENEKQLMPERDKLVLKFEMDNYYAEESRLLKNEVGDSVPRNVIYIKTTDVERDLYDVMIDQLEWYKREKVSGSEEEIYVLDLRDEDAIQITDAINMMDSLLPEGIMGSLIDNKGRVIELNSKPYQYECEKIYILVNENTEGAAEMIALSLKENLDNVVIIGRQTKGVGTLQQYYTNRAQDAKIIFPKYYWNIREKNISGEGITPDIIVEGNEFRDYIKFVR